MKAVSALSWKSTSKKVNRKMLEAAHSPHRPLVDPAVHKEVTSVNIFRNLLCSSLVQFYDVVYSILNGVSVRAALGRTSCMKFATFVLHVTFSTIKTKLCLYVKTPKRKRTREYRSTLLSDLSIHNYVNTCNIKTKDSLGTFYSTLATG